MLESTNVKETLKRRICVQFTVKLEHAHHSSPWGLGVKGSSKTQGQQDHVKNTKLSSLWPDFFFLLKGLELLGECSPSMAGLLAQRTVTSDNLPFDGGPLPCCPSVPQGQD